MLHEEVLKIFGGVPVLNTDPHALMKASGYVDIRFPDMYQATAWARIWGDELDSEPPVVMRTATALESLNLTGRSFTAPVTVTVTDTEGG
jgi:hypothetical protein